VSQEPSQDGPHEQGRDVHVVVEVERLALARVRAGFGDGLTPGERGRTESGSYLIYGLSVPGWSRDR
jgi:hypothetical protein